MEEETATPKGDNIPVSHIKPEDVSIAHRVRRPIFRDENRGEPFISTVTLRTRYEDRPEWPIINDFPDEDVAYQPEDTEVETYCAAYCVLPDFWKFHVLRLGMAKRYDHWKLDFSKTGWLAQNFTPHGAAAVVRDKFGRLRFPVWHGWQLHGDLGARLGLSHRLTAAQFRALLEDPHSEARKTRKKNPNDGQSWCLGDRCPDGYQFPQYWDVLGELPPMKRLKTTSSEAYNTSFFSTNEGSASSTKHIRHKPHFLTKPQDPDHDWHYDSTSTSAPSSISPVTDSGNVHNTREQNTKRKAPKFPKHRISVEENNEQEEITRSKEKAAKLEEENNKLRKSLDYADKKLQAVVKFSAHQDNVVNLLAYQFKSWKTKTTPGDRHPIEKEINRTIQSAEDAVSTLSERFPGLEDLVAQHDGNEIQESRLLVNWLNQEDHIEFPGDGS